MWLLLLQWPQNVTESSFVHPMGCSRAEGGRLGDIWDMLLSYVTEERRNFSSILVFQRFPVGQFIRSEETNESCLQCFLFPMFVRLAWVTCLQIVSMYIGVKSRIYRISYFPVSICSPSSRSLIHHLVFLFCAQVVLFSLSLVFFDLLKLKTIVKEEVRWNNPAFQAHPLLFPLRSARYGRTEGRSSRERMVKTFLFFFLGRSPVISRDSFPGAIICS